MKIKSTLVVVAVGGALMAVTAVFPLWGPLAALMFPCTALGAFTAWLIENQGDTRQEFSQRWAA
jgi:hypothetical protein